MNYSVVRELLDNVNPLCVADNSYRDFHCKGVDYICLHRTPELTCKLYVIDTDVVPYRRNIINPHNHGYNFHTWVLRGRMANVVYLVKPADGAWPPMQVGRPLEESDPRWTEYHYRTILNGQPDFTRYEDVQLKEHYVEEVSAGDGYYLDHGAVHTIRAMNDGVLVLFLMQHADVGKPWTRFFTQEPEPPKLDGLYRKFTADELGQVLEYACAGVKLEYPD